MTSKIEYQYNSLDDFLISKELNIDAQLDDGWGAFFPVKGREINATILFADISAFSSRTYELTPTEILIFVNIFFSWMTAEMVRDKKGIIDKYIGDEMMIIFSNEFGSRDPFMDALQTALWMCQNDVLNFSPHIGIASGPVTVGFVGTPLKYNCSVFGEPVIMASRCASVDTEKEEELHTSSVVFPSHLWKDEHLDLIFPGKKFKRPDGTVYDKVQHFELLTPREIEFKNMESVNVRTIMNRTFFKPSITPQERAHRAADDLRQAGLYRPRSKDFLSLK